MEQLKSLARGLMSAILKLGLFSFAIVTSLVIVLGNPSAAKEALNASGVYDTLVDNALAETAKNSDGATDAARQEELAKAAKGALPPAKLKEAAEQITDGIYAWLQGKAPEPNFRVDLTDEKQQFISILADSVVQKARQLPTCNLQQLRDLANSTPDPWNLPCLPSGYDLVAVREKAVAEFSQSNEFLPDPVITADDLPKGSNGQSVFQTTAADAPKIYSLMQMTPWILAVLTLFAAGGLLLLHDNKRRALKSIGIALLGTGIFVLIITAIYSLAFRQGFNINASNVFQQPLFDAMHNLQKAISTKLLWFGVIYTVLGLLSLLALHFNKRVEEIQSTTSLGDKQPASSFNDSVLPPPATGEPGQKDKNNF